MVSSPSPDPPTPPPPKYADRRKACAAEREKAVSVTHPVIYALVALGMTLLYLSAYTDRPLFGVRWFALALFRSVAVLRGVFVWAWAVHVLEALYGATVASRLGHTPRAQLFYFAQSVALGGFSMKFVVQEALAEFRGPPPLPADADSGWHLVGNEADMSPAAGHVPGEKGSVQVLRARVPGAGQLAVYACDGGRRMYVGRTPCCSCCCC